MRGAIFQPGAASILVGGGSPNPRWTLLPFAVAIEPDQIVRCRRLDPALAGRVRQHLAITFAAVAAHVGTQGRR
jgi:hypothetical protein